MTQSKDQFQRQLNLPIATSARSGDCACVATPYRSIRRIELRSIEQVECLHPEFKRLAFPNADVARQGNVEIDRARADQRITPRVAVREGRRCDEAGRIEKAINGER